MKSWSMKIENIIDSALSEDLEWGDITTESVIDELLTGTATLLSKGSGLLAGTEFACMVFNRVDPSLTSRIIRKDGSKVKPGDVIGHITGRVVSILKAERTALNILQRLSGIATETAGYVELIGDLPVRLLDTRKTTPGLRILEKYAVRTGGGHNHRMHLGDAALIKDDHLAALKKQNLSLKEAIQQMRQRISHLHKIEVEAGNLSEVMECLHAGADVILLDNMDIPTMKKAVGIVNRKVPLEASGNVSRENIRAIAETGVDYISVGAITHSAKILNISLELELNPS